MNTTTKTLLVVVLAGLFAVACGDTSYHEKCGENTTILTGGPGNNKSRTVNEGECPTKDPKPDTDEKPDVGTDKPDTDGGQGDDADTDGGPVDKPDTDGGDTNVPDGGDGPDADGGQGDDADTGGGGKCPEGEYHQGYKFVGIMLQMSNPDMPLNVRDALILNSVDWVLPAHCQHPKVLFVLDDNHHGEFYSGSQNEVRDIKRTVDQYRNYTTSYMDEPQNGLQSSDLQGYDAVWFSNPGYPVDDTQTVATLENYLQNGGHLILSGDDMSRGAPNSGVDMKDLTGLSNPTNNNGVRNCGHLTDNNQGASYEVETILTYHPVIQGIRDRTWLYGNDIDHAYVNNPASDVLAWSGHGGDRYYEGEGGANACREDIPTVFVRNVTAGCR